MSESKIETTTVTTTAVEHCTSPITFTDDVFHSLQNSNNVDVIAQVYGYQRHNSGITENTTATAAALVNMDECYKRSLATHAVDQLVNQSIATTTAANINAYPINQDAYPEQIRRHNHEHITYNQDVAIRYLQPPTPPPPAPVIVREIRAPQLPPVPPLIIQQRPPVPPTPPPIIIRERPPVPPPVEPPQIVNKYLPAPPPPLRKVIIERQAPLPQKPQPVIIEKWLPYKPTPQRRVVVEHAPPLQPNPIQKNTIITYDPPHVDVVKNIRELGTVRVDPHMYALQYGSQLSSSDYVLDTMRRFGVGNNYMQMYQMQCLPNFAITTNSFHTQQAANTYQYQQGGHTEYLEKHVQEIVLPDGHRKRHLSVSGTNEQELIRQAELCN